MRVICQYQPENASSNCGAIAAGAAVFTRRRDDRPVYDHVFDRYWRRGSLQPNLEAPGTDQRPDAVPSDEGTPQDSAMPGDERSDQSGDDTETSESRALAEHQPEQVAALRA